MRIHAMACFAPSPILSQTDCSFSAKFLRLSCSFCCLSYRQLFSVKSSESFLCQNHIYLFACHSLCILRCKLTGIKTGNSLFICFATLTSVVLSRRTAEVCLICLVIFLLFFFKVVVSVCWCSCRHCSCKEHLNQPSLVKVIWNCEWIVPDSKNNT